MLDDDVAVVGMWLMTTLRADHDGRQSADMLLCLPIQVISPGSKVLVECVSSRKLRSSGVMQVEVADHLWTVEKLIGVQICLIWRKPMTQDEEDRITENIDAVYTYLGEEFKGWRITKQAHSSDAWQRQKFTVLNLKEDKTFTLFVSRATLSDVRTTGKMAHELQAGKVAEGMRRAGENGYYWP